MDQKWTIETLKEHFDSKLAERDKYHERIWVEKDKALNAALVSSDKRLDLLNELRSGVATKEEVRALEKVVDDLRTSRDKGEGKGAGISQFIGWVLAAVMIAAFVIQNLKTK